MKFSKPLGLLSVIAGSAVIFAALSYVCTEMNGGGAACHITRLYAAGAGIGLILLGVFLFKVKSFIGAKVLSLLMFGGGVFVVLIPTVLAPVCKASSMRCRTDMMPMLIVIGVLTALIGLLFLLKGARKHPKTGQAVQPARDSEKILSAEGTAASAEAPEDLSDNALPPPVDEAAKPEPVLDEDEGRKKHFWNK